MHKHVRMRASIILCKGNNFFVTIDKIIRIHSLVLAFLNTICTK